MESIPDGRGEIKGFWEGVRLPRVPPAFSRLILLQSNQELAPLAHQLAFSAYGS